MPCSAKPPPTATHVGTYAAAVLEHPLPWTKMRQVYRLLGLVRRHGAEAVDDACRRALDAEVIDVGLIERMLTRGAGEQLPLMPKPPAQASRFVRDSHRFRRAEALMSPPRPDAAPAVKPIEVSPELKALMRRLKLGQLLDTLPERLALARTNRLPHHDFLEMLFDRRGHPPRPRVRHPPRQGRPPGPADAAARPGTTPPRSPSTSNCGPS